jgi:hypothetical protein
MAKAIYKPFGMVISALGAIAASYLFKSLWTRLTRQEDPPRATQRDRRWIEVLGAAAFEGAVFGLVKAAIDRAGAAGFERATGVWPSD